MPVWSDTWRRLGAFGMRARKRSSTWHRWLGSFRPPWVFWSSKRRTREWRRSKMTALIRRRFGRRYRTGYSGLVIGVPTWLCAASHTVKDELLMLLLCLLNFPALYYYHIQIFHQKMSPIIHKWPFKNSFLKKTSVSNNIASPKIQISATPTLTPSHQKTTSAKLLQQTQNFSTPFRN